MTLFETNPPFHGLTALLSPADVKPLLTVHKQVRGLSAKDGLKMRILPPPLCLSSVLG
jgi:hypothetical protein